MKWIKEHKVITILIVVIIILVIIIAGSFATGGSSNVIGRTFQSVVSVVEKPLSKVSNGIKDGFRGIFQFKEVVDENDKLKEEIADLKEKNNKLTLKKDEYEELKDLEKAFSYNAVKGKQLVAANVISVDSSSWMNVFTIDKGADDGIKTGAIVVNGSGLVGKASEVSKNTAKIVSVLGEKNKISFEVYRDKKLMGIVEGDGGDAMIGYMLDGKAGVIDGDMIITSGIGSYPEGLVIGKVTKVEYNKDTQYKEIVVKPAVKFKTLKKVAVIK